MLHAAVFEDLCISLSLKQNERKLPKLSGQLVCLRGTTELIIAREAKTFSGTPILRRYRMRAPVCHFLRRLKTLLFK